MRNIILVLLLAVAVSNARWLRRGKSDQAKETSFVGRATEELATSILQSYIDDEDNMAFSPLGYSAILAILAEGAKGETRTQLDKALHLPDNEDLKRKTYHAIMERLKNTNKYEVNKPEFKNYFYIYKNYTINDDYKKILEDYYLTDVKTVEKYNPFEKDVADSKTPEPPMNSQEDIIEINDPIPNKNNEKLISFAVEDTPKKSDDTEYYKPAKNIKEKIKLVKNLPKTSDDNDEEETMVAVEARNNARSLQVLFDKNDITSSMSVNKVGKSGKASASNSLMLIFNGMYFRGAWKRPFEKEELATFYRSSSEKKQVQTMKTRGIFRTGPLPGLDSRAIELPYDGDRYALVVLLPRARDGLPRLLADLPAAPLSDMLASLQDELLDVSLPTFYMDTTTKPLAALAKFGVVSIFNPQADLSGISPMEGLFVQEMVQHVAVRVDNAGSLATDVSVVDAHQLIKGTEDRPAKKFCAEHPFVFYIIDKIDNLIVVAGKVLDPIKPDDSFEF